MSTQLTGKLMQLKRFVILYILHFYQIISTYVCSFYGNKQIWENRVFPNETLETWPFSGQILFSQLTISYVSFGIFPGGGTCPTYCVLSAIDILF